MTGTISDPRMTHEYVKTDLTGALYTVTLSRPAQRNAISVKFLSEIDQTFSQLPTEARAVLLRSDSPHFCAGMDLKENIARTPLDVMRSSQRWHAAFGRVQHCGRPVIALLNGAVIGGGLELALSCHIRIATPSTIYQLPEAQRGLFVGGGATVRVGRLLGVDRMIAMMLTGAVYNAEEGFRLGLSHFLLDEGEAAIRAYEIADRVTRNDPFINTLVLGALSHIGEMPSEAGFYTESLAVAIAQVGTSAGTRETLFASREDILGDNQARTAGSGT